MLGLFLWGLVFTGGVAGAQELVTFLEPYRAASERGQVGTLTGAAFVEPRKRQEVARPLAGVTIVVLPPAPNLLGELEDVKAQARDSAARYLGVVVEVGRIQEAYEMALRQAGAAELIFTAVTDERGHFELSRVPAGNWVLLARHELLHAMAPRKIPQQERTSRLYLLEGTIKGYRAVTHWLVMLTVKAGTEVRVELHDRNPWLTGVAEEKTQGVIQKKTP